MKVLVLFIQYVDNGESKDVDLDLDLFPFLFAHLFYAYAEKREIYIYVIGLVFGTLYVYAQVTLNA